jgi:ADP-heptose:LPS heptosyltransferase
MCLPAIEALRRAFPNGRIGFLVPKQFRDLYAGHPAIDVVLSASPPRGKTLHGVADALEMVRGVRNFRPDVAFVFVGTPRYLELVLRSGGARKIYRIPNYQGVRWLLTNRAKTPENDWDTTKHAVEDRLRAVRLFGVAAELAPLRLRARDDWVAEATGWLGARDWTNNRLVVLQAGAGSITRLWPKERFGLLAQRLVSQFPDVRCIVTGAPSEREYCLRVASIAGDERVQSSAGELSITGVAGLLSLSTLLVTPDTGTMHLGHAVGVNSVCIYCLSSVKRTKALDSDFRHVTIRRPPPAGAVLTPKQRDNCMSLITLDEVYEACHGVIAERCQSDRRLHG